MKRIVDTVCNRTFLTWDEYYEYHECPICGGDGMFDFYDEDNECWFHKLCDCGNESTYIVENGASYFASNPRHLDQDQPPPIYNCKKCKDLGRWRRNRYDDTWRGCDCQIGLWRKNRYEHTHLAKDGGAYEEICTQEHTNAEGAETPEPS